MEKGSQVTIEFSMFLEDGTEVASNVGEEPLVFECGAEQILPALEEQLKELAVGESTRVTLAPADAFGEEDPEATQVVPLDTVPEEARHVGVPLSAEDDEGNELPVIVKEVLEDSIVLDMNHPLAGSTIVFDVKVLGVEAGDA